MMLLMAIAPLSAWGLSSSKHLAQPNKIAIAAMLGIPAVIFAWQWDRLILALGQMPTVVMYYLILIISIFLIYMFWRLIWQSFVIASLVTALAFFTYTQNIIALLGFFLVALVLAYPA